MSDPVKVTAEIEKPMAQTLELNAGTARSNARRRCHPLAAVPTLPGLGAAPAIAPSCRFAH